MRPSYDMAILCLRSVALVEGYEEDIRYGLFRYFQDVSRVSLDKAQDTISAISIASSAIHLTSSILTQNIHPFTRRGMLAILFQSLVALVHCRCILVFRWERVWRFS